MNGIELIRNILSSEGTCTLATASLDGKPEAATIEYAEDTGVLYFETFTTYRKYANLKENPRASIVITQLPYSIQMDGTAEELEDEEAKRAQDALGRKGHAHAFHDAPECRFFRFTPNWIRLLTAQKFPGEYAMIEPGELSIRNNSPSR